MKPSKQVSIFGLFQAETQEYLIKLFWNSKPLTLKGNILNTRKLVDSSPARRRGTSRDGYLQLHHIFIATSPCSKNPPHSTMGQLVATIWQQILCYFERLLPQGFVFNGFSARVLPWPESLLFGEAEQHAIKPLHENGLLWELLLYSPSLVDLLFYGSLLFLLFAAKLHITSGCGN